MSGAPRVFLQASMSACTAQRCWCVRLHGATTTALLSRSGVPRLVFRLACPPARVNHDITVEWARRVACRAPGRRARLHGAMRKTDA
eukprot:4240912-Lingulodinium_polyedra.AAC.1